MKLLLYCDSRRVLVANALNWFNMQDSICDTIVLFFFLSRSVHNVKKFLLQNYFVIVDTVLWIFLLQNGWKLLRFLFFILCVVVIYLFMMNYFVEEKKKKYFVGDLIYFGVETQSSVTFSVLIPYERRHFAAPEFCCSTNCS